MKNQVDHSKTALLPDLIHSTFLIVYDGSQRLLEHYAL